VKLLETNDTEQVQLDIQEMLEEKSEDQPTEEYTIGEKLGKEIYIYRLSYKIRSNGSAE
jgi:hypothetical protein